MYHLFNTSTNEWILRDASQEVIARKIHNLGLSERVGYNDNDVYITLQYGYSNEFAQRIPRDLRILDTFGRIIPPSDFDFAFIPEKVIPYSRSRYWTKRYGSFKYRYDAVPGIGHHYHFSRYYRRVKKGKRDLQFLEEEPVSQRKLAQKRWLIWSYWDDRPPRCIQKCWKKQGRSHQWKETN